MKEVKIDVNWVAAGINLIFVAISIVVGIFSLKRLAGKLRLAVTFLILSLFVTGIGELLIILGVIQPPWIVALIRTIPVLFSLMIILCIKEVIRLIDGKYEKILEDEEKKVLNKRKKE